MSQGYNMNLINNKSDWLTQYCKILQIVVTEHVKIHSHTKSVDKRNIK